FRKAVNMPDGRWADGTTWWVEAFPYFEQGNLYRCWDYNDYRNNLKGGTNATTAQVLPLLLCPSDPLPNPVFDYIAMDPANAWRNGFYGLTSYGGTPGRPSAGNAQTAPQIWDGIFFANSQVRIADVTDGTGNTFLLGERYHRDPEFDRITTGTESGPI